MRYWDAFQDKFGFDDGGATPPDAYACRCVYVREINKLAKKYKSAVRLLAWDRSGMHNYYLIVCVPFRWVRKVSARRLYVGQDSGGWAPRRKNWDEAKYDEAMNKAIQQAFDMDLDGYVTSTVTYR